MNIAVIIYAILAGVLPSLLWLWFWLREDNLHPEPRSLIAITFISGCLSIIIAVVLEQFSSNFVSSDNAKYLTWAFIEEVVKYLAFAIVILHSRYLDEPIDAIIYCITVALGFAAIENTLFILSPLVNGEIAKSIVTGSLRFIGSSLVHVVSSAFIGFMIGISFYKSNLLKMISTVFGIIIATLLHTSFNLAIISASSVSALKIFGWVWCAVIILIILFEEIKAIAPKESTNKIS
jgi:RsiW-degrading membrane proteinase PrsW (M82 family)